MDPRPWVKIGISHTAGYSVLAIKPSAGPDSATERCRASPIPCCQERSSFPQLTPFGHPGASLRPDLGPVRAVEKARLRTGILRRRVFVSTSILQKGAPPLPNPAPGTGRAPFLCPPLHPHPGPVSSNPPVRSPAAGRQPLLTPPWCLSLARNTNSARLRSRPHPSALLR